MPAPSCQAALVHPAGSNSAPAVITNGPPCWTYSLEQRHRIAGDFHAANDDQPGILQQFLVKLIDRDVPNFNQLPLVFLAAQPGCEIPPERIGLADFAGFDILPRAKLIDEHHGQARHDGHDQMPGVVGLQTVAGDGRGLDFDRRRSQIADAPARRAHRFDI